MVVSLLNTDLNQVGDLRLTATAFDNGERIPSHVGDANANENPELEIKDVPGATESLVLICDDPDAQPVVGFTFDHWLIWDMNPDIDRIPRNWTPNASIATVGYNDFVECDFGGPAPPDEPHKYRFKLLALDSTLGLAPEARKAVLDMTIRGNASVLAATQLVGEFAPSQGQ